MKAKNFKQNYEFNSLPFKTKDMSKLKKQKQKEKKKLERRAQIVEYISSEDDQPQQRQSDSEDFGILDEIDQDIIGYFQVKGQKILTSVKKLPKQTFDIGTLHLGAISKIGPNGAYLIVNFSRNRKGFVDLGQLRSQSNINAGDYEIGEFLQFKVIEEPKQNRIQLTLQPNQINNEISLSDLFEGMTINGIPSNKNEFGYSINFGNKGFRGFIKGENLRFGRIYSFVIQTIKVEEKLLVCQFNSEPIQQLDVKNKYLFHPGNVWPIIIQKEIEGGALVKLRKIGAIGYVFSDYLDSQEKNQMGKIISFDEKSRLIYLSTKEQHINGDRFVPDFKRFQTFDGVKLIRELYSKSLLVNAINLPAGDTKKTKKAIKANQYDLGPICFLHHIHIPENTNIDDVLPKKCMISDINYFDHIGMLSFEIKEQTSLSQLSVGEIVRVEVKQVIQQDGNSNVIVIIKEKFQGIIPQDHQSDYPLPTPAKFRVGAKIKARIISIDEKRNNIMLTVKPTLLTDIKVFSSLEEIQHADTLYGWVDKKIENGSLIKFFQNIVGFLSNFSLDGQNEDDIQVGQIIKVYVKYVNASEQKLFLSLKKVEPKEHKEHKEHKEQKEQKQIKSNKEGEEKITKKKKTEKKPSFQIGQQVEGIVTSIKTMVVYVNLPDGKFGRIHKTQFEVTEIKGRIFKVKSEFEDLTVGSSIQCTIIGEMKEDNKKIFELSCLQNYSKLSRNPEDDANKIVLGVVKKIMPNQFAPLSIEISYNYNVFVDGWDIPCSGNIINDLTSYVEAGQICRLKLHLDQNNKLKGIIMTGLDHPFKEMLYSREIFRVISHHESYIRVQLREHNYASIDITELSEEWNMNIFQQYQIGTWGTCRIISQDKGFWASTRETFLNEKIWLKGLHPVKSTSVGFKQILNSPYDVRNSLYKGIPLAIGQIVLGYVTGTANFGTFVKLNYKTTCLLPGFICDDKYRPIILMITKTEKLQGTQDINLIKYKLHNQQLRVGDVIDGLVTSVNNDKAYIKILGTLLNGELDKQNAEGVDSEDGWWANKLFKVGTQTKCIVIGQRQNKRGENILQLSNITELIQSDGKRKIEKGELLQDVLEIYESLEKMVNETKIHQKETKLTVEIDQNQNQQAEEQQEQEVFENEMEVEELEEEDQELQNDDEENQEVDEELNQEQLDSRAEYEKKLLTNPNSSLIWIEYAAYVTESEGIENARLLMERALRVVNAQNQVERMNLWVAYLNLEFNFGTEERLIAVFKKGCQSADAKQLYIKLIDIYRKAQKIDVMIELARQFVQKYKQSSKSWIELIQSLLDWQNLHNEENPQYSYKDTLNRAMQCLKKQKQTKVLAAYARLQFQNKQIEEGKTTFEALLEKNPTRTDIWSQYIDQAMKNCSPQVVRQIFQKAQNVNKKPRKIKFLFKKLLEFETLYGTEQTVQKVKQEAERWVNDYMQKAQQELAAQSESD